MSCKGSAARKRPPFQSPKNTHDDDLIQRPAAVLTGVVKKRSLKATWALNNNKTRVKLSSKQQISSQQCTAALYKTSQFFGSSSSQFGS